MMHGTIMLLLFGPLFAGFANAPDAAADRRARRRLPAAEHVRVLAYLFGGLIAGAAGFLTPGGAACRLVRLRCPAALQPRPGR